MNNNFLMHSKMILNELNEIRKWRADLSEKYFYITEDGIVVYKSDLYTTYDDSLYGIGNYFKTREEAEDMLLKIRTMFLEYHKKQK